MWVKFEDLPDHSRLWIYQSSRPLSSSEAAAVEAGLKTLCEQWKAHGHDLHASFSLRYQQFILLAVDESREGASGCSIDGSVRYLKEIQSQTGADFFDRTRITFLQGEDVVTYPMAELKQLFAAGKLTAASLTFNNAITTKGELKDRWKVAVEKSWLAKYLPKTALQD